MTLDFGLSAVYSRMNTIDLITLIVVIFGLFRGYTTGGIRQILSFAGIFIALIIAARSTESLGGMLAERWGLSEALAPVVAFALVFFVIQLVAYGVARLLKSALKAVKLGALDNVLGAGIGGFKALLVVSLVLFGARYLGLPSKDMRDQSALYNTVYAILPATWNFVAGNIPKIQDLEDEEQPADMDPQLAPRDSLN